MRKIDKEIMMPRIQNSSKIVCNTRSPIFSMEYFSQYERIAELLKKNCIFLPSCIDFFKLKNYPFANAFYLLKYILK